MEYIKVAQTSDLIKDAKILIQWENKPILLVKSGDTYYAIDNTCPHLGGSLFEGNLEGNTIICPRHGSAFDVTTGKNVQNAKILFLKFKVGDAHSYPVKVDGTDIFIGV
jgi:3-phenylpropionate/trans-cinnamate dioxygenase ferredoxin subunit